MSEEDVVGTVEACRMLGIDRSTLGRWSDERLKPEERRITPVYRLPNSRGAKLFRRADVERLRDERQEATA